MRCISTVLNLILVNVVWNKVLAPQTNNKKWKNYFKELKQEVTDKIVWMRCISTVLNVILVNVVWTKVLAPQTINKKVKNYLKELKQEVTDKIGWMKCWYSFKCHFSECCWNQTQCTASTEFEWQKLI